MDKIYINKCYLRHSSTLIIKKLSPLDGPSIDPGTEGAKLVGLYKYYTGKYNYISYRIWAVSSYYN